MQGQLKQYIQSDCLLIRSNGVNRYSSRSINRGSSSPCIVRGHNSESITYEQHCRILESGAALCRAKIATIAGGGGRGMIATQQIAAGESVLEIAAASVLSVPKHAGAVQAWRKWLSLYTAAYGALPDVLVEFLADTTLHHSVRLATWLLYLEQHCSSSSRSDSNANETTNDTTSSSSSTSHNRVSPYWCSYIAVLQESGTMTAVCTGDWQQAELQLLEPAVMRDWLCCHHAHARKATLAAYSALAGEHSALTTLRLASSSADVGWALGLVKTRAHGDADLLTLYPLHDCINHRERGLANVRSGTATVVTTEVGYVLQAVTAIQPGEEITNCYSAPMANPQILLGWGFTQPAKRADWVLAVPLQYGVLPQIPWKLAVHAAATVAFKYRQKLGQEDVLERDQEPPHHQHQQQQQRVDGSCKETSDKANSEDHIARLVTVAANLPLQLPESIWDGGQTYTAAAAAIAAHLARRSYRHHQQQEQSRQQQQQQPGDIFMPLIGSASQQEKIETLFLRDLQKCMQQLLQQQREQQQQHAAGAAPLPTMTAQRRQQQQQLQAWTAAVIRNACLIQLAECNIAIGQDEALLQQLQQQQNAPTVPHTYTPPPLQPPQQQQQQMSARQLVHQQLNQLQEQLVCSLALLSAYCNLRSMCEATAAAANSVLQALQDEVCELEHHLQLPNWQQQGPHLRAATTRILQHLQPHMQQMLQQQNNLLRELLCFQQDGRFSVKEDMQQQQQQHNSAGVPPPPQQQQQQHNSDGVPQQQQQQLTEPSAGVSMLNPARASVAVAARLEQKQLLAATVELCEELNRLLAVTDTGR